MADDDRAVRERLAALDAEVRADGDAQRARKDAAMQKIRAQQADQVELRRRQAELVAPKRSQKQLPAKARDRDDEADFVDHTGGLGGALELANRANQVKQELQKGGEKSWIKSGIASMLLGPLGWLYAGSWREAIPASAAWVAVGSIVSKFLPTFLLMPVLMVALPLSGIAGVVYALQYNRHGRRQRLFDKDPAKQLKSGAKDS
ncbi:hypothetical protein BH11MYX1_BH11MYX1_37760 [soil metagenome]